MVGALLVRATIESWPIDGAFVIARGAKREARVVVAEASDGAHIGRGECVPYPRYNQTPERTLAAILAQCVTTREALQAEMAPSPARTALDCALWDLEAKRAGRSAAALAGIDVMKPLVTCYTLSLDTPDAMAGKARRMAHMPLLKLKLGGDMDGERMAAVRAARPDARLVADANEAWAPEMLEALLASAAAARVELIEQPLPAGADQALARIERVVPVCADESAHARDGLAALCDRYDAVNIKLDKTGGLTEALAMAEAARGLGLKVMVGCMVATSLSMAPATVVAQQADWVDLDGPLLIAKDRPGGLVYRDGQVWPPTPELWG
jgi:L-alanine-DL-glutamate epimerase-like enolase superfamily enzyme